MLNLHQTADAGLLSEASTNIFDEDDERPVFTSRITLESTQSYAHSSFDRDPSFDGTYYGSNSIDKTSLASGSTLLDLESLPGLGPGKMEKRAAAMQGNLKVMHGDGQWRW